jgi:two-component SAPR family response regulator
MKRRDPRGLRVLVVEDEMLVAMDIAALLQDIGCRVVGPVGQLSEALPLAREAELDAAILDVNLENEGVEPVAAELARRSVPFVFATGYVRDDLPPRFRDRPVLEKPFTREDIETAIWAMCGGV